ncbi:MAG: glycosyltransferase [Clostridiales bacterium]|nr:glycosyltransferase [Clostridiales bacterium]
MVKVSIIIPIYNVEKYLAECLDSVTRQTLRDIEIICINDGSADGSLKILRDYAKNDERMIIVDKENGGYGVGMNIGMDMAKGEYIGIVEPDDFVLLNMYEDLYAKAKEFDLDFVKADFYRFGRNENGDMSLAYNHLSKNPADYNTVFNPSRNPSAIRYIMNTWSGIYRKAFLDENQIRHNETPGASFQDNGFYFQTFVYGRRAMIIDKPYYMNRRDNPNSSVKDKKKVYAMNAEYDYIRRLLVRDQAVWERFKGIYWWKKYSNYLASILRISDEFREEYLRRFAAEFRRAFDRGEADREQFTDLEWFRLSAIMEDPERFYRTQVKTGKIRGTAALREDKLERELNDIKESLSYRFGMKVFALPRMVKNRRKTGRSKGKL